MRRIAFTIALVVLSVSGAFSDSPLRPPEAYETCSPAERFCASVDPASGTTVFEIADNGVRSKLWSLPAWYRDLHVADNGVIVTGYPGLNLLSRPDAHCGTTILQFWRNGVLAHEVTLCEIVSERKLQKTASHYYWGNTLGFNADGLFEVATVDGRVVLFDGLTGKSVGERREAG